MQTALEYLLKNLEEHHVYIYLMQDKLYDKIDIALKMEMEQIKLAWENGALPGIIKEHKCFRDYFEETYKKHGHETF